MHNLTQSTFSCNYNYKLILDKVFIKFNKVFSLTNGIISVAFGFVCAAAATVDVTMGADVTDNDAISTVIPLSSTKDKGAYVGMSVAFEGACVGGKLSLPPPPPPLRCHVTATAANVALPVSRSCCC
jgi:hypothetical protein